MTTATATDALEATLQAWADRDWSAFSECLINIKSGENIPESTLRGEFDDIELIDYAIEDVDDVTALRKDIEVTLTRDWLAGEKVETMSVTLFKVGDDGKPDPDGTWTVTNRINLRSPGEPADV